MKTIEISEKIIPIIQLELSLGNEVLAINSGDKDNVIIQMKSKFHLNNIYQEIESKAKILMFEKYPCCFPKQGEGYNCKITNDCVEYVEKVDPKSPYDYISPNLHDILKQELEDGNKIINIETNSNYSPAATRINMLYKMQRIENQFNIASELVIYFKDDDIKAGAFEGYQCLSTKDTIGNYLFASPVPQKSILTDKSKYRRTIEIN